MKIWTCILAALLFGLGFAYLSLFIEHQNLQSEMAQQQAAYSKPSDGDCKSTASNTRLINPHAQMISTTAPSNSNTSKATDTLTQLQQENLSRVLEQKYSLLIGSLSLSNQDQQKLRDLLLERERILGTSNVGYFTSDAELKASIAKQQQMVAEVDHKIAQLLKPEEVKKYELLKDSAYEQYQMNSFYSKLGNQNNLSEATKNNLLLTKLEQKQEFSRLMQNNADTIATATPEERQFLAEKMHDALHDYKDNYLRVAKQNLSEEQFSVLREYEQQQFDEIWQSLKAGWQIQ